MSDMRQFVATPTVEELEAEIERMETFNRANWAALQEAQRQIERLEQELTYAQCPFEHEGQFCECGWER